MYADDDAVRAGARRVAAFYAKFHAVSLNDDGCLKPSIIFALRAKIKSASA
jgi:hypothetical protein